MNRNILKKYAPQARRDFIQAVTDRASYYGLTKKKTEPVSIEGDVALISGRAFPKKVGEQRKRLEERVQRQGFDQVMEAMAYTWFNRLVAIRFMELHGYLEHGYRVLSHPEGSNTPEILEHADSVDLSGLDPQKVIDLKLAGDKDAELYRLLLIAQCNALHTAMLFLFERIDDETELLLPDNLLHSDSLIRTLVNEIPEEDWQEVEIIGWLYQFYISEKKDEVIGKVVKSEDIPAATQLFTPNWIVKYLVQNSLGRQWMATYPNSPLKSQMEFYIEPAEQTPEVQEELEAITPDSLNPEELTLLDPACGSGHILVEAYDLLKAIYQERGYRAKDIPRLILEKNLFGLEIDDRAAQLAAFTLMMKARADDRRIFAQGVQPHVLSIRESNGLDAKEITHALNAPILKTELLPSGELFDEIAEEKSPLFSKKNLSVKGDISQADVAHLIDLFEHAKTFGSLIQVPESLAEKLPAIAQRLDDVIAHGDLFQKTTARSVNLLVEQARILAEKYDAVVTNPPYMGSRNGMNKQLKLFVQKQYAESKSDLFSAFIERWNRSTTANGSLGFVTPYVWMFISSFEKFRERLESTLTITSLVQLEYNAFEPACVPVCTFTLLNRPIPSYCGDFIRLSNFKGHQHQAPRTLEAIRNPTCAWRYRASSEHFQQIPGWPIAYWVSARVRNIFQSVPALEEVGTPRSGITTGDNDRFLRQWHEVSRLNPRIESVSYDGNEFDDWVPLNGGSEYQKWYGSNCQVIRWKDNGREIREHKGSTIANLEFQFKPGITWTKITSAKLSVRVTSNGFVFSAVGLKSFPNRENVNYVAGFLNSRVVEYFKPIFSSTLSILSGDIAKLPLIVGDAKADIDSRVERLVEIARRDWDSSEASWDFARSPLVSIPYSTLKTSYASWQTHCEEQVVETKSLEESNNLSFIEMYGLGDELSPVVSDDQITLYRPNLEQDIRRLISYVIGCMMGRYSIDEPGLIYAHSGGEGFDPDQYPTFPADEDGIVPITEFEWFEDDAANRFEKFLATAWPGEEKATDRHRLNTDKEEENLNSNLFSIRVSSVANSLLEENLKFVAESIGQKKNESARDSIRRYLSTGFYKHHLSLYKKRPIYWLFSSGKQRAFQCLVYLHRYNAGTLTRMRTEYVIPLSGKIDGRIEQLEGDITAASSTSHQKKLTRERDTLIKHAEELQKFDETLKQYADQRIELDLDDGVKVNYGKFGDLLAEVKAVTGRKPE